MKSAILYQGPSQIDGQPIVVIATVASKNDKTGNMVQTWILPQNVEPHKAVKSGADISVCGDCPHRGKACYVTIHQAPLSVYRCWKRGGYEHGQPGMYDGMDIRLGSYGDPAAVPIEVWKQYAGNPRTLTGYTHQWEKADKVLSDFCMASCDTPEQAVHAQIMGWRTFRVRLEHEAKEKNEAVCPASKEAGHKLQCADCGACCGNHDGRKGNIVIIAHGTKGKVNKFIEFRASL